MPGEVDTAAGPTEDARPAPIFEGVHFALIPSDDLKGEVEDQLRASLLHHGASEYQRSSVDSKPSNVTHFISTTADFPGFHDAVEGFIHVVKPSWVTQSIDKNRAANPRTYSPDPSLVLSDVVVLCAEDIPAGDKDAIIGGVHAMGGQYSPTLSRLVTHVVALSMNNNTCRVIKEKGLKCKPVLPHWFDACLHLGKRIGYEPYLLPNPPIIHQIGGLPIPCESQDIDGASTAAPDFPEFLEPHGSPSKQRRELNVFNGYNIVLSDDLKLSNHLKRSINDLITTGGGRTVKKVDEAEILICHWREGAQYIQASRAGLEVGNLGWLYYMIRFNKWTSPTRRLLHYPLPRNGIEGFEKYTISVSNYTGEARVYLENLVKAAGGKFTKSMAQENTHLITAHTLSEKCDAAREWGIHLINHLWLEESYAKCKVLSVTDPKYTHFPAKTNLSEVIGQVQIDRDASVPKPAPSSTPEEPLPIADSSDKSKSNVTPKARSSTTKNLQTPASRIGIDLVETSTSRGAKDRALKKLHRLAPDIALYEKESKRVGGVVYGGRKVGDPDRITLNSTPASRKRSVSQEEDAGSDGDVELDAERIPSKKQKKTVASRKPVPRPPTSGNLVRVLVTGYLPWKEDETRIAEQAVLRVLGFDFLEAAPVGDHQPAIDIIVAPKILRTQKFLSGIAFGPAAASTKWLEQMLKVNKRLPHEEFPLKDVENERKFEFVLDVTLKRAKDHQTKGGMLRDWLIFSTEDVRGGWLAFKEVIVANGGTCLLYRGRETNISRMKSRARREARHVSGETKPGADADGTDADGENDAGEEGGMMYLISTVEDMGLWGKFRKMTTAEGYTPRIVSTEWIRRIACSQDPAEWDADWEFKDETV